MVVNAADPASYPATDLYDRLRVREEKPSDVDQPAHRVRCRCRRRGLTVRHTASQRGPPFSVELASWLPLPVGPTGPTPVRESSPMRYMLRKLIFYLVTLWAAVTLNFLIPRLMPGNPVEAVLARFKGRLSPRATSALTALFGLNSHTGLAAQYGAYLTDLAHGNLGISFTYFPTPVSQVIGQSLPWTVGLIGISTVLSFILGTALGVITGWRRGSRLDSLLPMTIFLSSVPYFWLGLLALTIFGLDLHLFPLSGNYAPSLSPGLSPAYIGSVIYHGLLPAITIVLSSIALWLLSMRNMMITTLAENYVLMAEAKGLSKRRIMFIYAARNAILPSFTSFAMSLGFVVSGAILVEIVFSYPGVGYTLYEAVTNEDYPLMQGLFLIITIAVLAANFFADLALLSLDPRARAS